MERNILLFFTFKVNFVSCCCCCCLHIHTVRGVFTCLFAVCVRSFSHFMHIFDSRCSAVCFDHPAGIRSLPCCCLLDLISRQSHDLLLLPGRYYIEERLLKAFHFCCCCFSFCFCSLTFVFAFCIYWGKENPDKGNFVVNVIWFSAHVLQLSLSPPFALPMIAYTLRWAIRKL